MTEESCGYTANKYSIGEILEGFGGSLFEVTRVEKQRDGYYATWTRPYSRTEEAVKALLED